LTAIADYAAIIDADAIIDYCILPLILFSPLMPLPAADSAAAYYTLPPSLLRLMTLTLYCRQPLILKADDADAISD